MKANNSDYVLSENDINDSIDFLELLEGNDIESIISILEGDKLVEEINVNFSFS